MEKFTSFTGVAAPLRRSNVDTDQIIPAHFLKRVTKTGFDDALFYHWRKDASFVLNQPQYQGAGILVAGSDFGTGSSREHAVWALRDYGFQVVISARFADIFRGNAGKQGLLAAQVDESDVERIWQLLDDTPGAKLTVNLLEQTISFDPAGENSNVRDMNDTVKGKASGSLGNRFVVPFHIDEYTRWRLLEGYDDISLTLQHEQAITEFETKRPAWMPTTLPRSETTPQ